MKKLFLILCLAAPVLLVAQPAFPEVTRAKKFLAPTSSKDGALVRYSTITTQQIARDAKALAGTGRWVTWDYDVALLPFTSFRVLGRKDLTKTNETVLATVSTNRWAMYFSNGPQWFIRIDAVDVALPKTSLGRVK